MSANDWGNRLNSRSVSNPPTATKTLTHTERSMANLFSKELIRREANAAYYPNGLLTMEELTQAQVDAACRLHAQHLPGWQRSDSALNRLNELTPRFSPEVCLLKSATINAVYGTQVLAIMQMAAHVTNVLQQADLDRAGTELVEMIADLRLSRGKKRRRRTSFASKFCHFFVDPERFPIYDDAAKQALKLHLGRKRAHDDAHPYVAFCENFARLRTVAGFAASTR